MERLAAFTALAACLALVVLAAADGPAGVRSPGSEAAVPDAEGAGLVPNLRHVRELATPGATTNSGVGVYPALAEPARLTFPGPDAVQAARAYASTRRGRIAFAVADERGGIAGQAFDEQFASASLVKAMILVAYLERAERTGVGVSGADVNRLDAMIRVSDNDSASETFRRLGPQALRDLARRAGLRSFSIGSNWADARVSAADQARFFLALDRLLPWPRRREYARYLLSHIAPFQRWGIPVAAGPAWQVYFKGGWRPDQGGQLVHQAALLERGTRRLSIAVLTAGDPSEEYAHATIQGIAERLLRPSSRRASPEAAAGALVPIGDLHRFRAPEPHPLHAIGA